METAHDGDPHHDRVGPTGGGSARHAHAHATPTLPHRFPVRDAGEGLVQGGAQRGPGRRPAGPLKTLELQDAVDGALEMFSQHVVLLAGRGRRAGP